MPFKLSHYLSLFYDYDKLLNRRLHLLWHFLKPIAFANSASRLQIRAKQIRWALHNKSLWFRATRRLPWRSRSQINNAEGTWCVLAFGGPRPHMQDNRLQASTKRTRLFRRALWPRWWTECIRPRFDQIGHRLLCLWIYWWWHAWRLHSDP
jgi:hypothetical protein